MQFNNLTATPSLPMSQPQREQAVSAPMVQGSVSGFYGSAAPSVAFGHPPFQSGDGCSTNMNQVPATATTKQPFVVSKNQPFSLYAPNKQLDAQLPPQQVHESFDNSEHSSERSSRSFGLLVPPGVPLPGQGGGLPKARVFTRRKAGQASTGRQPGKDPLVLQYEDLVPYFGISQRQACTELGVGLSTMKRLCRRFGIKRWPGATLYSNEDSGGKTEEWDGAESGTVQPQLQAQQRRASPFTATPPGQVQKLEVVDQDAMMQGGSSPFRAFSVHGPQQMNFGVAMQHTTDAAANYFTSSPFVQQQQQQQQPAMSFTSQGMHVAAHEQYAHQATGHVNTARDVPPPSADPQPFQFPAAPAEFHGMAVQEGAVGGPHGESMEGLNSPPGGVTSASFRAGSAQALAAQVRGGAECEQQKPAKAVQRDSALDIKKRLGLAGVVGSVSKTLRSPETGPMELSRTLSAAIQGLELGDASEGAGRPGDANPKGDWLCTIDESWLQSNTNDDTTAKEPRRVSDEWMSFPPLHAAFPGERRDSLSAVLGGAGGGMRRDVMPRRDSFTLMSLNRESGSRRGSLWDYGPRRDSLVEAAERRGSITGSGRRDSLVTAARRDSLMALNQPGYLPAYTPTTPVL